MVNRQDSAPLLEALEAFKKRRIVPFDVPGHKRGKGNPDLVALLGEKCLSIDVNSMKPLDNLCHPVSVIREAEELAAEAFGAAQAFFMVNGTTAAVQSMILAVCSQGEKIIVPRNVHRSVINALVIGGGIPVYMNPAIDARLGIALGVSLEEAHRAIRENPDARAILINNPTYYGICSDLKAIVALAHTYNMRVLVDEAHGAHFYFGADLPISAMAAGADMAAVSMHKSGGSLTQSSILLLGAAVNSDYVRQIINLTQTTSASYLLLSSLDISRRNLYRNGRETFARVSEMAAYAREEINLIGDYYAYGQELVDGDRVFAFDSTKLSIHTLDTGLTGIEVYDLLRDEYDIQIEFGDLGNILAYISVGDRHRDIERLVSALAEIRRRFRRERQEDKPYAYITPQVVMAPKEAFYAPRVPCLLEESVGKICCESLMSYPPGIPILAPGERITQEIVNYLLYAREKGCLLTGLEDMENQYIRVWKE